MEDSFCPAESGISEAASENRRHLGWVLKDEQECFRKGGVANCRDRAGNEHWPRGMEFQGLLRKALELGVVTAQGQKRD